MTDFSRVKHAQVEFANRSLVTRQFLFSSLNRCLIAQAELKEYISRGKITSVVGSWMDFWLFLATLQENPCRDTWKRSCRDKTEPSYDTSCRVTEGDVQAVTHTHTHTHTHYSSLFFALRLNCYTKHPQKHLGGGGDLCQTLLCKRRKILTKSKISPCSSHDRHCRCDVSESQRELTTFFFSSPCFPVMFFGKSIFHRFLWRTPQAKTCNTTTLERIWVLSWWWICFSLYQGVSPSLTSSFPTWAV